MIQLVGERIEDDGDATLLLHEKGERDASVRNAVDEVASPVDRIDDPRRRIRETEFLWVG